MKLVPTSSCSENKINWCVASDIDVRTRMGEKKGKK